MLTFDPGRRLRARDALNHNFLAEHLNREPIALRPLNIEHEVGCTQCQHHSSQHFNRALLTCIQVQPQNAQEIASFILAADSRCQGNDSDNDATCGRTFSPQTSPRNDVSSADETSESSFELDTRDTHTLDEILNIDRRSFHGRYMCKCSCAYVKIF